MSSTHVQMAAPLAVAGPEIEWAPYLAGAGIGVLSWLVFVIVDDPLGITTAFSAVAGAVAIPFLGADAVWHNTYWMQTPPSVSYGTLFLVGVILGGCAAAVTARQFRIELVSEVWRERFGPSIARRFAYAFLGGAMLMFGARLAGGCTSGHSISGGLQLAVSSWEFTVVMFASALATGLLVFGRSAART